MQPEVGVLFLFTLFIIRAMPEHARVNLHGGLFVLSEKLVCRSSFSICIQPFKVLAKLEKFECVSNAYFPRPVWFEVVGGRSLYYYYTKRSTSKTFTGLILTIEK